MQDLIQKLTQEIGVTGEQAKGGAGLLFKLAQDKLGSDEFSRLDTSLPETDVQGLIDAAPEGGGGGLGGMLGGLASSLGGGAVGNLASLASGFSSLDLKADLLGKFVEVISNFIKQKGGDQALALFKKAL